jgi:hypothetical protein
MPKAPWILSLEVRTVNATGGRVVGTIGPASARPSHAVSGNLSMAAEAFSRKDSDDGRGNLE